MIALLTLAYNGVVFHGYQRQPNAITVEEVLFKEICGLDEIKCIRKKKWLLPPKYTFSSRTDAGVSALWQSITIELEDKSVISKVFKRINENLKDIVVWGYKVLESKFFSARRKALWRDYVYIDDPSMYKHSDLNCINKVLNEIVKLEDHSFVYKDYKMMPEVYRLNKLLVAKCWFYKKHYMIWVRGCFFTKNYVRRLVDFLRKYNPSLSFKENIEKWTPGSAEPQRLFLVGVKYDFNPTILSCGYELILSIIARASFKTGFFDPRVFSSFLSSSSLVLNPFSLQQFSP